MQPVFSILKAKEESLQRLKYMLGRVLATTTPKGDRFHCLMYEAYGQFGAAPLFSTRGQLSVKLCGYMAWVYVIVTMLQSSVPTCHLLTDLSYASCLLPARPDLPLSILYIP